MSKTKQHLQALKNESGLSFGILRLAFYPLTLLFTTPVRLFQLLTSLNVLFNRKKQYCGLNPTNAFNNLFYFRNAICLTENGKNGTTDYLGLGNYSLSSFFHYAMPSLIAFYKAPVTMVVAGMFGWLLFHLLYMSDNYVWLSVCMFTTMISPQFYLNLNKQNYNILGWLFMPLALYGLFNGMYVLAAIGWLLASFGGITFGFFGAIITFVAFIIDLSIFPILAFIPATLKLILQVMPLMVQKNQNSALNILKAIGFSNKNVKYRRIHKSWNAQFFYFLFLFLQFFLVHYYLTDSLNLYLLAFLVIFIVNSAIKRFADQQSMWMLYLCMSLPALILEQDNYYLLISFWISVAPIPIMANFFVKPNIDILPRTRPISMTHLLKRMDTYFQDIQADEKILMCFDDPGSVYENVFDGYRSLIELPLYYATKKKFYLIPDWWSVFELNYEGAPNIWGRDIEMVTENINKWAADYIIVYQDHNTELNQEWERNEFKVCSSLDWNEVENEMQYTKFFKPPTPKWWLLKVPNHLKSIKR